MIRVTLKNGAICYFNNGSQNYYDCLKSEPIKIEKQVKDLTLEEIHKLFGSVKKGSLEELNYFKDGMWHYIGFDDYVDITHLVKGGKDD